MPMSVYEKLKEISHRRNISMSKYVIDTILWRLEQEENPKKD